MADRTLFRRRDPFWEVDGPAARRAYRARRARGAIAFLAAIAALGATVFAWSIELGIAAAVGVHLALPAF
jgi:hypothetical protein